MEITKIVNKKDVVIGIIILSITFGITHVHYFEPEGGDPEHYFAIAENISNIKNVPAPFNHRIMTPLIVGYIKSLFNLPTWRAFYLINYIFLFLSALVFFKFLRRIGYDDILSLLGVAIYLSNYIIIGMSVFMVDPLFFLFYISGIYFIFTNKTKYLIPTILVGILNKELILLLIPYYLVIKLKKPYLSFFILALFIPYYLWIHEKYEFITLSPRLHELIENPIRKIIYASTSFSLLWFIAPLGYKNSHPFIKKSVFFLPFIFFLWLFATNLDRMTFLAFPIIIPLVLQAIKDNLQNIKKY